MTSSCNGETFRTETRGVTCQVKNVVYLRKNKHKVEMYVGQTKRKLRDRIMEHAREKGGQLEDWVVHVLQKIHGNPETTGEKRRRAEKMWIKRLGMEKDSMGRPKSCTANNQLLGDFQPWQKSFWY